MAKTRTSLPEDLRKWFGKGKEGGVGGGGWDRYNTKGERIGKCGGAEDRGGEGEGKPKCLSKQKADQLRAKGGKQAIANAVKRKKEADPVTDRKGTGNAPRPVSNRIDEANEPTNPGLWSRAKAEAKKRFDVYPSAYANGWAAKWYKARGGGWRSKKSEETNTPSDREWGTSSLVHIYQQDTPGEQEQLDIPLRSVNERIVKVDGKWRLVSTTTGKNLGTYDTKAGAEKRERQVQYFKHQEEMTLPSFSEYLREFGDRPFTWKITADTSEYMTARFDPPIPSGEEPFHYEVFLVATKYPERKVRPGIPTLPPLPIEWEFGFALVRPSNTKYDRSSAELRDGKYYYDTLVGDTKMSLAVMSTIGAVFAQMLRMRRPVRVFFSAKGESRVRLYRRLAGRIASAVPGYSAKEEKPGYWAVTPTRG